MKGRAGFTLMELLVVLLIIGILSTVALRTIDATRDRGLFDKSAADMNKLVHAIVGNPDLTYDGKRVDFGYFGDMEELPTVLQDLVRNPGSTAWHGPYLRRTSVGGDVDSSYRFDGWGRPFTISSNSISSSGSHKYDLSVKICDDLSQLTDNVIVGVITDHDDNPPDSAIASLCTLKFYYNNNELHPSARVKVPRAGGYYEYSPAGSDIVPIGIHKLVARVPGESLVRWVTVVPRSRTVVDFKSTRSFYDHLQQVESTRVDINDSAGFLIKIANNQHDPVTIDWIVLMDTPDSACFATFFRIGSESHSLNPGVGRRDTVHFTSVTIAPDLSQEVEVAFQLFNTKKDGSGAPYVLTGKKFKLRFSDLSEIEFTVP